MSMSIAIASIFLALCIGVCFGAIFTTGLFRKDMDEFMDDWVQLIKKLGEKGQRINELEKELFLFKIQKK